MSMDHSDSYDDDKKPYNLKGAHSKGVGRKSILDSYITDLIDPTNCEKIDWRIEFGVRKPASAPNTIIQSERDVPYYRDNFHKKDHVNYVQDSEDDPILVSLQRVSKDKASKEEIKKALVRCKKYTKMVQIPPPNSYTYEKMLSFISIKHPEIPTSLHKIKHPDLEDELLNYENRTTVKNYKFGILYMKANQKSENDLFSNVETTPMFEEFLVFLGKQIKLEGWTGYRGGLDVKTNTTGTQSIYTTHLGFEIMFHVSTYLPFYEKDVQQVERKRHIGNDVVVIVFKESEEAFDPLMITSHFNHVFVVVQPESSSSGKTRYKVGIALKPGIKEYGPLLPLPAVFDKDEDFREFFLTKLINSERAAMNAPDFKGKLIRTRKEFMNAILKDLKTRSKKGNKNADVSPAPSSRHSPIVSAVSDPHKIDPHKNEVLKSEAHKSPSFGRHSVNNLDTTKLASSQNATSSPTNERRSSMNLGNQKIIPDSANKEQSNTVEFQTSYTKSVSDPNLLRDFVARKTAGEEPKQPQEHKPAESAPSPRPVAGQPAAIDDKNGLLDKARNLRDRFLGSSNNNNGGNLSISQPVLAQNTTPSASPVSSAPTSSSIYNSTSNITTPRNPVTIEPISLPDIPMDSQTITHPNGDVYIGQFSAEGERSGRGKYIFQNGDVYDGEFSKNNYEGRGILTKSNGDRYEGYFSNDKYHGRGVCVYAGGDRYEGEYKAGERHGMGLYKHAGGNVYDGEFARGRIQGRGRYVYTNGDSFEGNFKDGLYDGYGVLRYSNGDQYSGNFSKGMRHGKGNYSYKSGAVYEGDYINGSREGIGMFIEDNKDKYEGEWKNGKPHGKGKFMWQNGDVYIGDFKDDNMEGVGVFTGSIGKYEGEFKEGKRHGKGKWTRENGDVYEGTFVKGLMDGEGSYKWASTGNVFKGQFKAGKPVSGGSFSQANTAT